IQHQIDIGALPFDSSALYLLVTSGDVAVTIGGETFCGDYCSKQSTLKLRGPDGSVGETKFIHAGDVFARCPVRCTFRAAHATEPNPLRHLLRHLGSAITESLPGPDAGPIMASEFPELEPLPPATVAEASASGSAAEQENATAAPATTAKMCAAFPAETFIHAITYGSNSSGVSSGALAGDITTCAAASVGAMVVPPTVAGRAKSSLDTPPMSSPFPHFLPPFSPFCADDPRSRNSPHPPPSLAPSPFAQPSLSPLRP
ncbi:unnamed protein product, partial [Closterium sp. Naga37s-1]